MKMDVQLEDVLYQPTSAESVCQSLSIFEINRLRKALNLDFIPCRISIEHGNKHLKWINGLRAGYIEHINMIGMYGVYDTLIHYVKNRNIQGLKIISEFGFDLNTLMGGIIKTPLMLAASLGDEKVVRALINLGVDVNFQTEEGAAIKSAYNHPNIIKLLIDAGADVNVEDKYGTVVLMLVDFEDFGNTRMLMNAGADLNIQSDRGNTPLINAIHYGIEYFNLLLSLGVLVDIQGPRGKTALIRSVEVPHGYEYSKSLLKYGADPDITDDLGQTALTYASMEGNIKTIELLGEMGADPNILNNEGNTALMAAVKTMKTDLENDARVVILSDIHGNHIEETIGLPDHDRNFEVVKWLMRIGTDPDVRNLLGETAEQIAANRGLYYISNYLARR